MVNGKNRALLHGTPPGKRDCLAGWFRWLALIRMTFFCVISFGDDLHLLRVLVVPHVILIFILGSRDSISVRDRLSVNKRWFSDSNDMIAYQISFLKPTGGL